MLLSIFSVATQMAWSYLDLYQVICVHTHAMHSLSVCNGVFSPLAVIYPKIVSLSDFMQSSG